MDTGTRRGRLAAQNSARAPFRAHACLPLASTLPNVPRVRGPSRAVPEPPARPLPTAAPWPVDVQRMLPAVCKVLARRSAQAVRVPLPVHGQHRADGCVPGARRTNAPHTHPYTGEVACGSRLLDVGPPPAAWLPRSDGRFAADALNMGSPQELVNVAARAAARWPLDPTA